MKKVTQIKVKVIKNISEKMILSLIKKANKILDEVLKCLRKKKKKKNKNLIRKHIKV